MYEYDLTSEKLSPNDIDFKIYKDGEFLFYLEVKGRIRTLQEMLPLDLLQSVNSLKMTDKKQSGVILWACLDGIVFSRVENLRGEIKVGGRMKRDGSANDIELMAYYNNSSNFKFLHYEKF